MIRLDEGLDGAPTRHDLRRRERRGGVLGYVPTWLLWMLVPLCVALALGLGARAGGSIGTALDTVNEFPHTYAAADIGTAIGSRITSGVNWVTENFEAGFTAFDNTVEAGIERVNTFLLGLPWPALILLIALVAWRVVGPVMGIFTLLASLSIVGIGMWDSTLLTVTLIIVSLTIAIIVAIPLGILAAEVRGIEPAMRTLMDTMQTLPSMVYLVPALAVFGLGNVAGVIATVVFVIPPAFKFVFIGIKGVPHDTADAAESFGASWYQVLVEVKLPLALPSIMAGISQATMASLSIVIVASLVGAKGLGDIVEHSLGWLDPGTAMLAGFAIVIVAVVIDRITESLAKKRYEKLGFDEQGAFLN